jgi:glyoxylase I family protein
VDDKSTLSPILYLVALLGGTHAKETSARFHPLFTSGSPTSEQRYPLSPNEMIEIVGCLHIAVMVVNLDRAVGFYSDVLGLQRIDRGLNYPGAWYQVGDVQIHLIEDLNYQPNHRIDLNLSTRNPHVALGIRDLEPAKQQLLAANHAVKMSNSGRAALFTQDPDGNVIELTLVDK